MTAPRDNKAGAAEIVMLAVSLLGIAVAVALHTYSICCRL